MKRWAAHQFRNHFGYYMERAADGTEILISRRGKPTRVSGRRFSIHPPLAADIEA